MTDKPLFWIEVRCENMMNPPRNNMGESLCHETGHLGFFRLTSSARKDALKLGWSINNGDWFCPSCANAKTKANP